MNDQFGISGKLGMWFLKFLENRTQQVLIEEIKSKKTDVVSGAGQGSVLGPVFFLMYMTDMTKDVTASIKLFVDDAKVKKNI